jgi:hypothetical protein
LNITNIIGQIDAEIGTLQTAKALLTGAVTKNGPGRPKRSASVSIPAGPTSAKRVVKRAAKKAAKAEAAAEPAA